MNDISNYQAIRFVRVDKEVYKLLNTYDIECPLYTINFDDIKNWAKVNHNDKSITLSYDVFKFNDYVFESVFIHAILHLIVGNNQHNYKWKKLAEQINKQSNFHICTKYFNDNIIDQINKELLKN